MPMLLTLPDTYGYVAAAVVSAFWLTLFQARNVGQTRKRAGVQYPQMYAEKAEADASKDALIFNCAQRAHQNTLEWVSQVVISTLLVGTRYPITAASLCGLWVFSRIFYTTGYTTGDPKKRLSILTQLGNTAALLGLVIGGNALTLYDWFKH